MNMINDNKVTIVGEILTDFQFDHEIMGEKFYRFDVAVTRNSGTVDKVPVVISEKIIDVKKSLVGEQIFINGQFRSYNKQVGERRKLVLFVFVLDYEIMEVSIAREICNHVEMTGFICKEPVYRTTPNGREIADLLVAVNRPYGKSDFIPCICWGRNAVYASGFSVGDKVSLTGRVQSREYQKKTDNGCETRVAYELSVVKLNLLEDETNEE